MQSDTNARRALHEHVLGLHEALDRLEADDTLRELDYLLVGAEALFQLGVTRFEQLAHNLRHYGRSTPPAQAAGGRVLVRGRWVHVDGVFADSLIDAAV